MRNTILTGLALTALAAAPATAETAPALLLNGPPAAQLTASLAAVQSGGVQVWTDGNREVYRPGERMRVRVRPEQDGYLAVFHIDTNGDVDILFPYSEADEGWVEGGRTLSLGSRGGWDYLRVNGGYGMGYVMAVTLDEPLETYRMRDLYGARTAGWDDNRTIYGDPFYAMDEIVRAIVPEGAYGYESVDYATYHIGRRYRYPRYACYDGYGDWYSYRGNHWSDCDRVRILLVNYPYYYDTHRWRGSRRVYYERYYYRTAARNRPLHGYKERTDSYAPPPRSGYAGRPTPSRRDGDTGYRSRPGTSGDRTGSASGRPGGGDAGGVTSRRPERRSSSPGGVRSTAGSRGSQPRSAPGTRPARATPPGSVRPQQQGDTPPQQDRPVEPNRERPTFQRRPSSSDGGSRSAQPRREASPPSRSAQPRQAPPSRSAQPRQSQPRSAQPRSSRPSGGSRSSSPPASRRGSGSSNSGSSRPSSEN